MFITADFRSSHAPWTHRWYMELQHLANEFGIRLDISHFPPGTSKWTQVDHRMVCSLICHCQGRPVMSREVVVNLITPTTTATGLEISMVHDAHLYPIDKEVSTSETDFAKNII